MSYLWFTVQRPSVSAARQCAEDLERIKEEAGQELPVSKQQNWNWICLFRHAGEYSTRTGVASESVLALESGVEVGAPSPTFLGHIS